MNEHSTESGAPRVFDRSPFHPLCCGCDDCRPLGDAARIDGSGRVS